MRGAEARESGRVGVCTLRGMCVCICTEGVVVVVGGVTQPYIHTTPTVEHTANVDADLCQK